MEKSKEYMDKVFEKITPEIFNNYVDIQYSGEYNMVMNGSQVADEIGIPLNDYWLIIENYDALKKAYLSK